MLRAVLIVVLVSAVFAFVSPAQAAFPWVPQPVREQNLDANCNIKVHEQGTVQVEGTVGVSSMADLLAKLDAVLAQLQAVLNVQGSVQVTNLPPVQEVAGAVQVTNLPAVQGSVEVTNLPLVQQVAVTNPPPVQEVAGTVEVSNLPARVQVVGLGTMIPSVSHGWIHLRSFDVRGARNVFIWHYADGAPDRGKVEWKLFPRLTEDVGGYDGDMDIACHLPYFSHTTGDDLWHVVQVDPDVVSVAQTLDLVVRSTDSRSMNWHAYAYIVY